MVCLAAILLIFSLGAWGREDGKIDREALVKRHNVVQTRVDRLSALSVGNGRFCCTVDITGMQTFPEYYRKGIPLSIMAEWGWHHFPNRKGYRLEDTFRYVDAYDRKVPYPIGQAEGYEYLRANPHQMGLALIGLARNDGQSLDTAAVSDTWQQLDLWTGVLDSRFRLSGQPVEIVTFCHPEKDQLVYKLKSSLLAQGDLGIRISFPYPSVAFGTEPAVWNHPNGHISSIVDKNKHEWTIEHRIDDLLYYCHVRLSDGNGDLHPCGEHAYYLETPAGKDDVELFVEFSREKNSRSGRKAGKYASTLSKNKRSWRTFWQSGGAVDLSESTDGRWKELERRIVLSQYLTAIQSRQQYPPQETGLTCNSWYGKFHLEMHWWHSVHFALWGRAENLANTLPWYEAIKDTAEAYASRQGYKGVRWPKMIGPDGREAPSLVGPLLVWQQPHFIYYAELMYREDPSEETLRRYESLVEVTAEFMYDYAHWDDVRQCYVLGPPIVSAREGNSTTYARNINPTFELAYWSWGLRKANDWRVRMGKKRREDWDHMASQMASWPVKDGVYVEAEAVAERDAGHPTQLAAYGFLPASDVVDYDLMRKTLRYVLDHWDWSVDTWGWDFPLMAMTATRLHEPEWALEALLKDVPKNTYLLNGHNYQRSDLPLYLPGNGGLLMVVAMMCAGWDGCEEDTPGFPKDGQWRVKWEGLKPAF